MTLQPTLSGHRRRLPGLAATLALHLALLFGWLLAHKSHPAAADVDPDRIQWVNVAPARPVPPPARPAVRVSPALAARVPPAAPRPPPAVRPATAEPAAITLPAAPAPLTPSADQMLQQARKDLGKIDKDLQKEFPGAKIKAPADSPQLRLEQGIEHAAEMAPPKWYEAPKISELIDPGGTGHKRYRIITANGTYCATYNSQGRFEKMTNCPPDEQPATTQKW